MTTGVQEQETTTYICEDNLEGACQWNGQCPKVHYSLPYLWQVNLTPFGGGVYSFPPEISLQLESCFCRPEFTECRSSQQIVISESVTLTDVCINFDLMRASVKSALFSGEAAVNRLSTMSYVIPLLDGCQNVELLYHKYFTQWRWYWYHSADGLWKVFGEDCLIPDQQTLEMKFSWPQRQMNYRFEGHDGLDFVIELEPKKWFMTSLPFIMLRPANKEPEGWPIRRRPLLMLPRSPPRWPAIKLLPFVVSFPSNWTPLDRTRDWELVKLSKDAEEFKTVNEEFVKTIGNLNENRWPSKPKRSVKEIFRLQNPFVWQKYISKRNFMEANNNAVERFLFHGTQKEGVIKGICRHGFDIRCNGVNNTLFGKGAYFAVSAGYSDKYSYKSDRRRNWMFLARVLVGKYAAGNKTMSRPPPLDVYQPYAELHDSCVDDVFNPKIFVVFDSDQCYPEYVIGYADAK